LDERLQQKREEAAIEEAGEELVDDLEKAQAEAADYLDRLQRIQAEFANYKKRNERERKEFESLANAALIGKLLPILDDLQRALETRPDEIKETNWGEGVALIERRLRSTLEQEGLSEIEAVGKSFDPQVHHAVVREETDEHEEDQVIGEIQKGYRLHDRLLRPSMVVVAGSRSHPNTAKNDREKGV
jgi:molecular chaperone GrpE